ncbi:cytokinesis protein 3, partial [Blyttiomyces sp. JEL0837]
MVELTGEESVTANNGVVVVEQSPVAVSKKSVTIDHAETNQRVPLQVDGDITLTEFKKMISTRMDFDPAWISVFYTDSGLQVNIVDDQSLGETLKNSDNTFSVECSITVSVIYETTAYAIKVHSTTLDELKRQVCKEFAFNRDEFDSMEIVHESMVIAGLKYYQSILRSCCGKEKLAEFTVRPKISASKPANVSFTIVNPIITPSTDSTATESYDVMLSYEWKSGKDIIVKINEKLKSLGLRVWFDEEEMHANMYERMAEAITKSRVITPLLTVPYSRSANCKRELFYAADLKKHIEPTRALQAEEKLENWAELITAGMIYYDLSNTSSDIDKFNQSVDALYTAIRREVEMK